MLDELRKKPRALKEAYAFWGAFAITGLIALVWVGTLSIRFSAEDSLAGVEGERQTASALSQFFSEMKDTMTDTWRKNQAVMEADDNEGEPSSEAASEEIPAPATTTPSTPSQPVLIATTSSRTIQIATSSQQNR